MAEQWHYIAKMNNFITHELKRLTPLEAVLYLHLFKLNNESTPPRAEWFEVKNIVLAGLMEKDPQNIRRMKKSLKEKGLIDFTPGRKGQPTKYKLLPVLGEVKGVNKGGQKLPPKSKKGGQNYPENDPLNDPLKVPNPHISCGLKGVNREKRKEIYTPLPPKGGVSDLFLTFYKSYPKKRGKQAAERAFLKLKPDTDLFRQIMAALEAQKKSPDWQKEGGQYILYPATWLNGRRWEDEIIPAPSQSPTREEQEARRRAKAEEEEKYLERMQGNG